MKKYYLFVPFIFTLFLLLSSCIKKDNIPDIAQITEIVTETIRQDSLDITKSICPKLLNRYIYNPKYNHVYKYAPPPPRDKRGEPFVLKNYKAENHNSLGFAQEDSVFIAKQIKLNMDLIIDTNRIPENIKIVNAQNSDYIYVDTYLFLVPIFNKDKTLAIVEYEYNERSSGFGKRVFFKRINNQWLKIDSYTYHTWKS